jgi:hypothetical protein
VGLEESIEFVGSTVSEKAAHFALCNVTAFVLPSANASRARRERSPPAASSRPTRSSGISTVSCTDRLLPV